MPPAAATSSININRVLKILWDKEPISRVEIARILDLDKSTVSKMIQTLLQRRIARSLEQGNPGPVGGRKPTYMGINPDYGAVLGVEVQTDFVRVLALRLDGTMLFQETESIGLRSRGPSQVFEEAVSKNMKRVEAMGRRTVAAGFGVSGIVDPFRRQILRSMPLAIEDPVYIDEAMEERLGIPIFVENDARCCCWGDLVRGRGSTPRSFLYLLGEFRHQDVLRPDALGIGVGFGFVIDGKLHYGSNFAAGEFRSIFKEDRNLTQFSMPSMDETFLLDSPPEIRGRVFRELARNLAFLFNMLNLNKIGVAGDLLAFEEELREAIVREVKGNWAYTDQAELQIDFTGPWSVAYGAAAMILEQMFANPQVDPTHSLLSGIELFDRIETLAKNRG